MLPIISPFRNDWISFIVLFFGIIGLIGLSELIRIKLGWKPEVNRKLVHVLVGSMALTSPFIFVSNIPPTILGLIFLLINLFAIKTKFLEGIHSTKRKTYGTVYFPLAYVLLCIFWWDRQITFQISLLILTFADTTAALIGENFESPHLFQPWRDKKSIQGSLGMGIISILLTYFGTMLYRNLSGIDPLEFNFLFPLCFIVGLISTFAEMLSDSGSDNLSVPIISAITYDLYFFMTNNGEITIFYIWALISFLLILLFIKINILTIDGALGAFIMGLFIFGSGGWKFIVPIGLFFLTSSLLSKVLKNDKYQEFESFTKNSNRDLVQVYANGGVPMLISILWLYNPSEILYIAFLASVASATADTWATEIGIFSKMAPRNCISFRKLKPGVSGGITLFGTIGSLFGALIIGLSAQYFLQSSVETLLVLLAGFTASIFDSVLGATIQATYSCSKCGKRLEKSKHCKKDANLVSGSKIITNDMVNLLSNASGAMIIILIV
mgnify:FL=1|tara:strand:- start:10092 stop:11582 length:1491 start_codon:yes stop_codon:yes gene_type:complete